MRASRENRKPVYQGRARVRLMELKAAPCRLFSCLAHKPGAVFLDSSMMDRYGLGRWSFLMYDPLFIVSSRGDTVAYRIGRTLRWEHTNPFVALRRTLALFDVKGDPSWIPFRGGAAGFFSYELGRQVEKLPETVEDDLGLAGSWLGLYDNVLAYDHVMEQWFISNIDFGLKRPGLDERMAEARAMAQEGTERSSEEIGIEVGPLKSNFSREKYVGAVEKARQHIVAGDIYQMNMTQRFMTPVVSGSAWDIYERLRQANPAPFAAFLQAGGFQIMCSSPERFLRVSGDQAQTRPIKGTRPRGATPVEDRWYKAQLLASEKDHAELAMIVDLERNDLGRVCRYGTVNVSRHAQCESYARVHHLVSTVEGALRNDCDVADLLTATFPGGSITGAPKIRAMEIIDDLETHARSVYTGSIGYIGFDGDLDLNIAIRTMIMNEGKVSFGVGGGIVFDSDPGMEYEETMDKGRALIEALGARTGGF